MMLLRSLLFVPGNRPERFAKALIAGADLICIDLEDAVAPEQKQEARRSVQDYLASLLPADRSRICVRINALSTAWGEQDLQAFKQYPPAVLMLAKCQSALDVQRAAITLPVQCRLIALIETVHGLQQASTIAKASKSLVALMFGGADLSAELGCDFSYEPLLFARSQLVLAAAGAGLQLIDVPFIDLDNEKALQAETKKIKALGFTGKAAIHPKQVAAIHQALLPTAAQLDYAKAVLAATANHSGGVLVVQGRMIDRPVILGCQRILAFAGERNGDNC